MSSFDNLVLCIQFLLFCLGLYGFCWSIITISDANNKDRPLTDDEKNAKITAIVILCLVIVIALFTFGYVLHKLTRSL